MRPGGVNREPGRRSGLSFRARRDDACLADSARSRCYDHLKRLTNIVYVLGSLVLLGSIVGLQWEDRARQLEVERVAGEVRRFQQVIKLHAATKGVKLTGRGWPTTIDPSWFGDDAPTNTLLSPDRPWVEVAMAEEAHLLHPNNRIASDSTVSMFWYNPYQGVIRTRIPPSISDQRALTLYNRLNRTDLISIFPTRQPANDEPDLFEPDAEQPVLPSTEEDVVMPDGGSHT